LIDAEAVPVFLPVVGIPLSSSIADGLALGFVTYPVVKLLGGRGRDVHWLAYVIRCCWWRTSCWCEIVSGDFRESSPTKFARI